MSDKHSMYDTLAVWWPLLSPPEEYEEEATFYLETLRSIANIPLETLLELGSGGGNNASYLKAHFEITLVDQSPQMLAVSCQLNPECEHLVGDMRTVRLDRQFDAVFIHDAIDYMLTEHDLHRAMETAYLHCREGGVALLAPDYVRETFEPSTEHGGTDGPARGMRYLEWTYDPDETDTIYTTHYTYVLREAGQPIRVEHEEHTCGLFPREMWLRLLSEVGFEARTVVDVYGRDMFVGVKARQ